MPDYNEYRWMVTFAYRLYLVISPLWNQLTRIHENRRVSALSLLTLERRNCFPGHCTLYWMWSLTLPRQLPVPFQ